MPRWPHDLSLAAAAPCDTPVGLGKILKGKKGTGNIKWQRGKILETPGWMTGGCVKARGLAWRGEATRHQVQELGLAYSLFLIL